MKMNALNSTLIIPVEEQSREFDAKLLLACVAAERGYPAILGSRRAIHLFATRLPRGIYYAKSFRSVSLRMFRILHGLGHEVVACDEEGLLPYPDDLYFERRAAPETLALISNLFAWGPENAALFRRCPGYGGAPIHATGNPRVDVMRPEVRGYFDPEVEGLRRRFGKFILVNTNFGTVNHRVPGLAWMKHVESPRGNESDSDAFKAGLTRHRLALFSHFKRIIPELGRSFPNVTIVVRPHPVEDHGPWRDIAAPLENVCVVHEGSVIPWLIASSGLVQNNCTTAIEAFVLECPVVTFRPIVSERFDSDLTNSVSYQANDAQDLCSMIHDLIAGNLAAPNDPEMRKRMEQHISALDGPLASDRIMGAIDATRSTGGSTPSPFTYATAWLHSSSRTFEKNARSLIPGDRNNRGYQHQRFPGISADGVRERVQRFRRLLGRFEDLQVTRLADHIFRIDRAP
jgi:surface carbohydrate biosynthesis protein